MATTPLPLARLSDPVVISNPVVVETCCSVTEIALFVLVAPGLPRVMLRGPVAAEKSRVSLVGDGASLIVVLLPQLSARPKVSFCVPLIV